MPVVGWHLMPLLVDQQHQMDVPGAPLQCRDPVALACLSVAWQSGSLSSLLGMELPLVCLLPIAHCPLGLVPWFGET